MYGLAIIASAVLLCLHVLRLALYRLYFSPVAKFPGRRLAVLTFWYELYYDAILGGQYTSEIARMHEEYGPIIRINPEELHIKDSDFYNTLYVGNAAGRKVDKWARQARMFGVTSDAFGTVGHDLHHSRRAPLAKLFSKRSISQLEPVLYTHVDKLAARIEDRRGTGVPVNLFHAYAGLTGDVILDYAFGTSLGYLERPTMGKDIYEMVIGGGGFTPLFKQFGWIFPLAQRIPERVMVFLNPLLSNIAQIRGLLEHHLLDMKREIEKDIEPAHKTIFHELYESSVPAEEKETDKLIDYGQTLMGAGTVTTANTLAVTSFHVIDNSSIERRLRDELSSVDSGALRPRLRDLEQLPYLSAIIKEGLRISYGIYQRLPRVAPDVALEYHGWSIPPRTPVGMTGPMVHDDQDIFPDPRTFNPERWLDQGNDSDPGKLERYLVAFSKGTRQCVAINLAYAEMYLTLGAMFAPGKFTLGLFETSRTDAEPDRDIFFPGFPKDSKGIRVTVE